MTENTLPLPSNFETGICLHCGERKEEHSHHGREHWEPYCGDEITFKSVANKFTDSGTHRVRENSEEVLRAARKIIELDNRYKFIAGNNDLKLIDVVHGIGDIERGMQNLKAAIARSLPG